VLFFSRIKNRTPKINKLRNKLKAEKDVDFKQIKTKRNQKNKPSKIILPWWFKAIAFLFSFVFMTMSIAFVFVKGFLMCFKILYLKIKLII
jgi:hypothetical protein